MLMVHAMIESKAAQTLGKLGSHKMKSVTETEV
jgi:hypothetical protein